MNEFKNKILSVLLLAFTFFVIHDFVIEDFSKVANYKSCKHLNSSASVESCEISELDHSVHHIFDVHVPVLEDISFVFFNTKPNTDEQISLSFITFVPDRPPVI